MKMWSTALQEAHGPWHLQGIEILDKSSGRTFFFPCLHWLDASGKAKSKLQLGPRPPSATPTPPLQRLAEPEEEEHLQPDMSEDTAETVDRGVGGCYTVSCQKLVIMHEEDQPLSPLHGNVYSKMDHVKLLFSKSTIQCTGASK